MALDFKRYGRRVAGKRAKYSGAGFENVLASLCAVTGVSCVRIPDGCRQVGPRKLIRVHSPFDFCLCYQQQAAFIDSKSSEGDHFPYSKIWARPHQVPALEMLAPGGRSGFVLALGNGDVYFADVSVLRAVEPGGRVPLDRCVRLGTRIAFDPRKIFL